MTVFITEKPSVARDYDKVLKVNGEKKDGYIEGHSKVLNTDVIITWAIGHLITISAPGDHDEKWATWSMKMLPILPDVFKYEPIKDTAHQFKVVEKIYNRNDIDCLYYAGDSGREGIYIQALIRNQIFKSKPTFEEKVVWIDNYTEESILNGIKNAKPYSSYKNMINSGYMRDISDWLIGMNFSPAFSIASGPTISVGRVMTPTLAMIVNRQNEIDNFVKTPYFGIKADSFATWKAVKGSKFFESEKLYKENGFKDRKDADDLVTELSKSKTLTVSNVKATTKTEYAPYLFNLADLQAFCTKHFKISPADALDIAQSLYEKKLTTYPRTDSRFLSSAVAAELKEKHSYDIPARYVNDAKITDHHAIIPTFETGVAPSEGLEKKVYDAILKRFKDTMLPPYIYDAIAVTYEHDCGEMFFENFRVEKQLGFKENNKDEEKESKKDDDEESTKNKAVPSVGDAVTVSEFSVNEMETAPPPAYTTGSLILAMEKAGNLIEDEELREQIKTCGIGTSATRANIIEKLREKKYIAVDKAQKVSPTEFGCQIVSVIGQYDKQLISPVKTADMEAHLEAIAKGEATPDTYLADVKSYITELVKMVAANLDNFPKLTTNADKQEVVPCPCCGKPFKSGQYGWFCTDREGCKFHINTEILGHKMKKSEVDALIKTGKSPACEFVSKKTNKKFKAYLVIDKEKRDTTFEFDKVEEQGEALPCPCCEKPLKLGQYGWFCTNKDECGFSFGSEVCGHKMKKSDLEAIIKKGETPVYEFTSKKSGKTFKAKLKLNKETKKAEFEFAEASSDKKGK